ncbi:hypothetical protein HPP92_009236 [Vanilla planifolia]|uniref:Plantacyanin n=1 Tax=Vanilla planifolia TaxID=51239 RepID=A0A835RDH6_VANPL|nr:hypothetical protein HPP92_009438 [Vanilla planifolia]KAG0487141.1 hypothetical protein HPP92_009236 [Vanilla planifolia]
MGTAANASVCFILAPISLVLLLHSAMLVESTEHLVGDAKGWSTGVSNWPRDKLFLAGDVLVFKYNSKLHNVAKVNKYGFMACEATNASATYTSGEDYVTLKKGMNQFICGYPEYCKQGMKIKVFANP